MPSYDFLLPLWLLGAPLLLAIIDWMRTPSAHGESRSARPTSYRPS